MQATIETKKINLSDFEKLFRVQSNELTDQELLSLDFLLHRAWNLRCGGGSVYFGGNAWEKNDLAKFHAGVLKEMERRAFHHIHKDELNDQTKPFLDPPPVAPEVQNNPSVKIDAKEAPAGSPIEKKLAVKKAPDNFPNLVLNEEAAVGYFRKGKAASAR